MSRASVQGIDVALRSIIFKKVIISSLENDWPKNLYEIFKYFIFIILSQWFI